MNGEDQWGQFRWCRLSEVSTVSLIKRVNGNRIVSAVHRWTVSVGSSVPWRDRGFL